MPETFPITSDSIPGIVQRLNMCVASEKKYQVVIREHNDSLKERQRELARCWYRDISQTLGWTVGYTEAYCKRRFGLRLLTEQDPDQSKILHYILDNYSYEDQLTIIESFPQYFPVLRDKGGLTSENQARYLTEMQRHFAEQNVILTSPKEKDLFNCKAANQ